MGSEGYKLNESECVLKCDSSWCVSQAVTAALPWPSKQGARLPCPLATGTVETQGQKRTHKHVCTHIHAHKYTYITKIHIKGHNI